MHTLSNPLWPAFDAVEADLHSSGAREAIGRLVASLARHRHDMNSSAWKDSCGALDQHPALPLLLEDPYSRDARLKPSGYAGDARTLDYVYLRESRPEPLTELGRSLFAVSTGVPIADAVRERSLALSDFIARHCNLGPITVASIACGHARELDHLPAGARRLTRFWGIDQDARSVEHCRARFATDDVTVHVGSVRDVITGRVKIPTSDLVYASGLFDYLDERSAAVLIKRMFAATAPGGSVVVPNLSPRNEEAAYMEAVMDWWMYYRTEDDMRRLAEAAGIEPAIARAETFTTSDDRIVWLQIDRLG